MRLQLNLDDLKVATGNGWYAAIFVKKDGGRYWTSDQVYEWPNFKGAQFLAVAIPEGCE